MTTDYLSRWKYNFIKTLGDIAADCDEDVLPVYQEALEETLEEVKKRIAGDYDDEDSYE